MSEENVVSIAYILEWEAGARPPVHPNPMVGKRSFASSEDAITFFNRQASDSRFISLVKVTTIHEDVSNLFNNGDTE